MPMSILALAMSFRAKGGLLPHERQPLLNVQRTQFYAECEAVEEGREYWDIESRERVTLDEEPIPLDQYVF